MNAKKHKPDDPTISPPVLEMITVANEYCLFFERAGNYKADDILEYYQKMAPLLYLKGALLPVVQVSDEAVAQCFVTEEQWETVFRSLREQFKSLDVYYVLDHHNDTTETSLSENMADIYQDLKDFLMLYQKNMTPARESAIAQLRKLYQTRWGPAIITSLQKVHHILYKDAIDPAIFDNDDEWLV